VIDNTKVVNLRKWWNWQTHHLEGVAPKGVGVQIPPSAPAFFMQGKAGSRAGLVSDPTMNYLIPVITAIHILVSFFLIIVVLLQSGKSGDIAAAFGGMGSQTAFGPRGAATALSKATTISAVLFMVTSITLSIFASRRIGKGAPGSALSGVKQTTSQPAPKPAQPTQPSPQPAPAQK
jgi:preprotein translocase subunit SecG